MSVLLRNHQGSRTTAVDTTSGAVTRQRYTTKGTVAYLNRIGQEQLDGILTAPGAIARGLTGDNFAGWRYYIAPDGRGAASDAHGVFQYFGVFRP